MPIPGETLQQESLQALPDIVLIALQALRQEQLANTKPREVKPSHQILPKTVFAAYTGPGGFYSAHSRH